MKTSIFTLAFLSFLLIGSTVYTGYQVKPNTAEVEEYMGVKVFVLSKPISKYSTIGRMKTHGSFQKYYQTALQKAFKRFPEMEGAIVIFDTKDIFWIEGIKFE